MSSSTLVYIEIRYRTFPLKVFKSMTWGSIARLSIDIKNLVSLLFAFSLVISKSIAVWGYKFPNEENATLQQRHQRRLATPRDASNLLTTRCKHPPYFLPFPLLLPPSILSSFSSTLPPPLPPTPSTNLRNICLSRPAIYSAPRLRESYFDYSNRRDRRYGI